YYKKSDTLEQLVGESFQLYPLLKIPFFTFLRLLKLLVFISYSQNFSYHNLLICKKCESNTI
ncbi:hypothetical protein, partial [Romboutsia ilealis]|uniref:hypothetical protein n=1 Tax=Romboutsia ilealis TaxID=1115758 RepID=UPI00259D1D42